MRRRHCIARRAVPRFPCPDRRSPPAPPARQNSGPGSCPSSRSRSLQPAGATPDTWSKSLPFHAAAVRVTRGRPTVPSKMRAAAAKPQRGSGRFYRGKVHPGAHLAAQQFQQDHDPVLIAQFDELADHVLEGAGGDADGMADARQPPYADPVEGAGCLALTQYIDDCIRHRGRLVAGTDDAADANGREDRPPRHRGSVDAGEQIARKQRPRDNLAPPRVTDLGPVARQISQVPLAQQVLERDALGLRPGIDGIRGDVRRVHAAAPGEIGAVEMPRRLGATTRPAEMPWSAALANSASNCACGAWVSVSTTPSSPSAPTSACAAAMSGSTGTPAQRRPARSGSITQTVSMPASPALRIAISARSLAP